MLHQQTNQRKNLLRNRIICLALFCFVYQNCFLQTRLINVKKISRFHDENGDLFKLAKNVFYREVVTPLESFDEFKEKNQSSRFYSCYFKLNDSIIYLDKLMENVFYDVNWVLSKKILCDKKTGIVICSLAFFSGSNSNLKKEYFRIDRKSFNIHRIPNIEEVPKELRL